MTGKILEWLENILKFLYKKYKNKPNKIEKKVLGEAIRDGGRIYKLSTDQTSSWVRIGNVDYAENREEILLYLNALESLVQKNLAKHVSHQLYEVTNRGMESVK